MTATPIQLSACSIIIRSDGARRRRMARGAVTSPLISTLSAAVLITGTAAGMLIPVASAGATE